MLSFHLIFSDSFPTVLWMAIFVRVDVRSCSSRDAETRASGREEVSMSSSTRVNNDRGLFFHRGSREQGVLNLVFEKFICVHLCLFCLGVQFNWTQGSGGSMHFLCIMYTMNS